jgi:imidazolonepropionase-like amidohydrolase
MVHDEPIGDAEVLPGRYVLPGLVDAHAHPAVTGGPDGPVALDAAGTRATLVAWAETGVTLVRDVGSPAGVTLSVASGPGQPQVRAAGRFLAPAGRYFPQLLVEPVGDNELISAALDEIGRGATWVKVIADFPRVPEFIDLERTYPVALIAGLADAVHAAGARVAAHMTLPGVVELVAAGIDSVEHGTELDPVAIEEMGRRGVAWTPTLCALPSPDAPNLAPEQRQRAERAWARMSELLPLAVRHRVPVLAGTDVVGSLPREVSLLAEYGLEPNEAMAAASEWGRRFIDPDTTRADIVTYRDDPRDDPALLAQPAAVVVNGTRLV